MAFSATVDIELRTGGNDLNGGGFNTASGGTDRSQQDAAQVFIDGATITGVVQATTTDILLAGYTVLAGDVGNVLQVTGGTATAGFYQIVSVNTGTNTWTMDRAVGTAAQTVVGRMGGGLATLGKAGSVPIVAGNRIWVKYHATNVYTATSTTNNVANGRITIAVGTTVLPVLLRGYDVTHGDNTGNRPTLRWGVNAASTAMITFSNVGNYFENFIFDGNRANFTSTRGISLGNGQQAILNVKFMGFSALCISASGSTSQNNVVGCEFTDSITSASVSISSTAAIAFYGCLFHDNQSSCISSSSTAVISVTRCEFDTNTTAGNAIVLTSTSKLNCQECVFYNMFSSAIDLQNSAGEAQFINCIFETNGAYGVGTSAAGVYGSVRMQNCAFYNNTTAKYDTAKILAQNVQGEIAQSAGSFFTNAGSMDFTPNNTAGQGALLRATAYPTVYPGGTNNYQDISAQQSQASAAGLALPVVRII